MHTGDDSLRPQWMVVITGQINANKGRDNYIVA